MEEDAALKKKQHHEKMDKFLGDSVNPRRVIKQGLHAQLREQDEMKQKQRQDDLNYFNKDMERARQAQDREDREAANRRQAKIDMKSALNQ